MYVHTKYAQVCFLIVLLNFVHLAIRLLLLLLHRISLLSYTPISSTHTHTNISFIFMQNE